MGVSGGITTYGDVFYPTEFGSSGSVGAGGGAIHLFVDILTLNGSISANGEFACGSGAGGSIIIEAASIIGEGICVLFYFIFWNFKSNIFQEL